MNQTTLKIAAAGLLHDIGKFADRDVLDVTEKYYNDNAGLYLPFYDGRFSHHHALCTAAFIETLHAHLPPQFNSGNWGQGDAFINLAAGHHKPETALQWIIAVADRVSSGWDRDTFDKRYAHATPWKDYKKTRLLPVFEQLSIKSKDGFDSLEDFNFCYPLETLTPESIFAGKVDDIRPPDATGAAAEYRRLYDRFVAGLSKLEHRDSSTVLWLEHFDSLLMSCTAGMPAARAGNIVPDVSLYDHSRITAALAAAIYLFHRHADDLSTEKIQDYGTKKFLIINGDFHGIQKFIFSSHSETARYRSKLLRGRSFMVSLLTELAADLLCRQIGLPFTSVILNAAGKLTLIAPNTASAGQALATVQETINDWLVKVAYGEMMMSFSSVAASCNDFVTGRFTRLWDEIVHAAVAQKLAPIDLNKYGGPIEGYLDSFVNVPDRSPLCAICGKRPSVPGVDKTDYVSAVNSCCKTCRDQVFIGANLVKKDRLVIADAGAEMPEREQSLFDPIFKRYQLFFPEKRHDQLLEKLAQSSRVIKYWNLETPNQNIAGNGVTVKMIGGYVPRYDQVDEHDERILHGAGSEKAKLEMIEQIRAGDPKTLNHIACKALLPGENGAGIRGTEALGVLKADVDHLGLLMACGLKTERMTLSRLATLSRQLNNYFSVYLPYFLENDERFREVYTVFAGGDDLFLIGPWNRIIDLAAELYESFNRYTCSNSEITFSAGISLHKPRTPIDTMAAAAESALEAAKNTGRNRITLFSESVPWPEIRDLIEIRRTFEQWLDKGWISRVLFYRFNEFIRMAAREKQVVRNHQVRMEDMACTKWRAMLAYAAERNVAKNIKGDQRSQIATEVVQHLTGWLETYGGKLIIPVWYILYNRR